MDYNEILEEINEEIQPYLKKGQVADYIPALKNVEANDFAMSIKLIDGSSFQVGCHEKKFSIQSISKVFTFSQALNIYSTALYKRVWHEPSGNAFNSLIQLEYEKGIPRNPFINAGAIVTTDALMSHFKSANLTFDAINAFINKISKATITYDEHIYKSEVAHGFTNRALINLMKSYGNIHNDTSAVLNTYFKHCSLMMNSDELSNAMLYLCNHGTDPLTQEIYLNEKKAKRVNSLMLTCGHYDASGDFAFQVGLPGKSGVAAAGQSV